MTCVTDGILRAKFDGELGEAELLEVEKHLAACHDCRVRADVISRQAESVRGALSTLAPSPGDAPADARLAFARLQERQATEERQIPSLFSRLFPRRLAPVWGAAAALGLIVALLSFAPARGWGQRILAMLRVQKITVVPVDLEALNRPSGGGRLGRSIGQLVSDDIVVTMKPGEPQPVSTSEQASELAGFKVRLPSSWTDASRIKVLGEQAFHMTVNRERVQTILDEAGRSDLQLPVVLDGATIAVHVPKLVMTQYGDCSRTAEKDQANSPPQGATSSCANLIQVPSPTVSIPPDLNMAQIAELGLQLGGMSAEDARRFSQTIDWTSTLVIGIPQGVSYQTVDVDGVQGTLVELPHRERSTTRYALLWVKTGIIYALDTKGNSTDAVSLAESLN